MDTVIYHQLMARLVQEDLGTNLSTYFIVLGITICCKYDLSLIPTASSLDVVSIWDQCSSRHTWGQVDLPTL